MILIKGYKIVASTVPNKEIVRRVCHLAGATECYLLVETNDEAVEVLTNIADDAIISCLSELESWSGVKFRLFTYSNDKETIDKLITTGEKILPIVF